jgi:HEAT repeat protein
MNRVVLVPGHEHRFERVLGPSGSSVYQCACGATSGGPELHFRLREARRAGDVATLIEGLNDPAEGRTAARFLGDVGASESVPSLLRHLRSADSHMRSTVLISLGKLRAMSARPQIEEASISDEVPWVRSAAVEAAEGVMLLESLRPLLHRALQDKGWNARFVAARTLERVGDSSDLSGLRAAKKADVWWRRGVYRKAIRAIRRRAKSGE